jgi:uncharacterized membrane protein
MRRFEAVLGPLCSGRGGTAVAFFQAQPQREKGDAMQSAQGAARSVVQSERRAIQSEEQSMLSACCAGGPVNVGSSERVISLLGGGVLLAYGLSRGGISGLGVGLIGGALAYRGWTGHCHTYDALGISTADHNEQTSIPSGQGIKFEHGVLIQKPADELYRFWRKLDNLPRVMRHLVAVQDLGNKRSRWTAKGPTGNVQWEAEIITERPGEMIGWRSLEGSTVDTAGSVHFHEQQHGRGTEVRVVLSYNPPAGRVGHALAWLTGSEPGREIREDLQNFKRMMETTLPTSLTAPISAANSTGV